MGTGEVFENPLNGHSLTVHWRKKREVIFYNLPFLFGIYGAEGGTRIRINTFLKLADISGFSFNFSGLKRIFGSFNSHNWFNIFSQYLKKVQQKYNSRRSPKTDLDWKKTCPPALCSPHSLLHPHSPFFPHISAILLAGLLISAFGGWIAVWMRVGSPRVTSLKPSRLEGSSLRFVDSYHFFGWFL
jgi:hypothetical protein